MMAELWDQLDFICTLNRTSVRLLDNLLDTAWVVPGWTPFAIRTAHLSAAHQRKDEVSNKVWSVVHSENTLFVPGGYLSYCWVPISSSGINKPFSPRDLLLAGYFLLFSVNPRKGCVTSTSGSRGKFKVTQIIFLLMLSLNFRELSWLSD